MNECIVVTLLLHRADWKEKDTGQIIEHQECKCNVDGINFINK